MPTVRPIAVAISDLHLSLLRPACRADANWLDVQAHYLKQIRELALDLPVLIAGDVFDRWNAPAELINFALRHLPHKVYAVPGQHDLPNHQMEQIHRSGYGVLVETGRITDLSGTQPVYLGDMTIQGFGWNAKIVPFLDKTECVEIALIHKYCWTDGKSYPGAPEESNTQAYKKALKGYDIAIFGDNHKSFVGMAGDCRVVNIGGFIRRKSDEIDHQPSAAIIMSDGTVKRHKLDTSIDKFHEGVKERPEATIDMKAFIDQLEELGEHGLDFREVVEQELRKPEHDEETRRIILACLDNKGEK